MIIFIKNFIYCKEKKYLFMILILLINNLNKIKLYIIKFKVY